MSSAHWVKALTHSWREFISLISQQAQGWAMAPHYETKSSPHWLSLLWRGLHPAEMCMILASIYQACPCVRTSSVFNWTSVIYSVLVAVCVCCLLQSPLTQVLPVLFTSALHPDVTFCHLPDSSLYSLPPPSIPHLWSPSAITATLRDRGNGLPGNRM